MQGGDLGDLGLQPVRGPGDLHLQVALGVDRPAGDEGRQLGRAEAGLAVVEVVAEAEQQLLADEGPQRGGEVDAPAAGDGHVDPELGAVGEGPAEAVEHRADRLLPLGPEGAHAVDDHQDPGLGGAGRAEAAAALDLGAQPGGEAGLALPVVGLDHGADVGEAGEDVELAGADSRGRRRGGRRARWCGPRRAPGWRGWSWCPCRGGPAISRLPSPGTQPAGTWVWSSGVSARAKVTSAPGRWRRARAGRPAAEGGQVEVGGEGVGPGAAGVGAARRDVRGPAGLDQQGEVGGALGALGAGRAGARAPPRRKGRTSTAPWPPWATPVLSAVCTGMTSPGPEAGEGPAGLAAPDAGRVGDVDHVVGVAGVLHPQGDAEVGVGPDVLADRTAGPLGGEDHVDAEAAAPLGHADQGLDEVGQLGLEGGELVDDHDEPGQGPAPASRSRR